MTSLCPKYIAQGKTTFMVGDVSNSSTGGIKEGPSKRQPQWQQWEWHEDIGGGGECNPSIKGTAAAEGHFKGKMFQMWRVGPLCIPVSFETKA